MIRILQSVNIMDRAGLETMLMNYYRHFDREIVQFDFLTHRPQEGAFEMEIKEMGGNVYHAPRLYIQNLPSYYRYMKSFYREHGEYKIIHSHIDAMSYFPLSAAKKSKLPIRIAHSHSSKLDKDLKLPIKYLAQKSIPGVATHKCACGKVAGQFMFPKDEFQIIHNAINLDEFRFDNCIRKVMRRKLNLEGKFVIGHVGRYCYIKNQLFLLDILSEILKVNNNAVLLLIGKGEDEDKIRSKIDKLGLKDNVQMLIDRSDVDQLYQVFDIFVMPSLFEGLPVVGVEAQANGLPCIVSDKVSSELILSNSIKMLPLELGANKWAKHILNTNIERNTNAKRELQNNGYDISIEALKLQKWYEGLYYLAKKDGGSV